MEMSVWTHTSAANSHSNFRKGNDHAGGEAAVIERSDMEPRDELVLVIPVELQYGLAGH